MTYYIPAYSYSAPGAGFYAFHYPLISPQAPYAVPHFTSPQAQTISQIGQAHIQPALPKNITYDPKDEGNPDVLYATNLLGLVSALDNYFSDISAVSKLVVPFMLALTCITSIGATLYEIVASISQLSFINKLSTYTIEELYDEFFALSKEEIDLIQKRVDEQKATCKSEKELQELQELETNKVFKLKLKALARHIDSKTIAPLYRSMRAYIQCSPGPQRTALKAMVNKQLGIARIQAKKKLVIHIIGLLAPLCVLILTAFSLFSIACPLAVPLTLLITIIVFSIARYLLSKGWMPTPDWSCSIAKAVLPPAVYKKMMSCFDSVTAKLK